MCGVFSREVYASHFFIAIPQRPDEYHGYDKEVRQILIL